MCRHDSQRPQPQSLGAVLIVVDVYGTEGDVPDHGFVDRGDQGDGQSPGRAQAIDQVGFDRLPESGRDDPMDCGNVVGGLGPNT
jgi:hypothetical protein